MLKIKFNVRSCSIKLTALYYFPLRCNFIQSWTTDCIAQSWLCCPFTYTIIHSAVPDQVSGVRFTPSTMENSLSVEWSRPQSDAPILHYEIWYRLHTGRRTWQGPIRATTEMGRIRSAVVPSASYGVQVRAVSAIGDGPYSREEIVRGLLQRFHANTHTQTCMYKYSSSCHTQCMMLSI